jgi:dynein heavy chain
VLSVVAQQMLSILNALKALQHHQGGPENPFSFVFEGAQIPANDQCAIFITMNPGYAGRS